MLFEAYAELIRDLPVALPNLLGREVQSSGGIWLSINQQCYPSLLFPADASDGRSNIALRYIDVEFSRACEIATKGAVPVSGTYTIVRLNEDDPEIVRVFLRLVEGAFCQSDQILRNRDIGDRMLEIADLFSKIDSAHGDIVGLWGELYIISRAVSVLAASRCWCLHKSARHDFVAPDFVLEVKTTVKGSRRHRFSLEQLRPANNLDVYVASLQLVEAHGGRTVAELLESIYEKIEEPKLRSAFFNLCLTKGGQDIYRSERRLLLLPSDEALAIFHARDIPVPAVDSEMITNVRFDVDLSQSMPADAKLRARLLAFDNPVGLNAPTT